MGKEFRKIVIAADRSGAGKTTVCCGLLGILKKHGIRVQSFKCGPDYIDPMFHRRVLGVPSGNLDSFFTDAPMLRRIFRARMTEEHADFALIEGVMGYYDGLGGVSSIGSTWEIAQILEAPTILVLDAKGASVTMAALLRGMMDFMKVEETTRGIGQAGRHDFSGECATMHSEEVAGSRTQDRSGRICGVILNRVSPMFYPRLKSVLEEHCLGVEVLGYLPELPELQLPSRHLGLVEPEEIEGFRAWASRVTDILEAHVDMARLWALAGGDWEAAASLEAEQEKRPSFDAEEQDSGRRVAAERKGTFPEADAQRKKNPNGGIGRRPVRIAVSEDEAFNFTYQENRLLLEQLGAELVPFSPLHDVTLPTDIDGMILSGGYPELYKEELQKAASMRNSVAQAVQQGLPTLAECGGYMYLLDAIEGVPMCGVLRGDAERKERLVRFGYVEATTRRKSVLGPAGTVLRGHEFHRYDCDFNGADCILTKPAAGQGKAATTARSYEGIYLTERLAAGFPHFYYWSNPDALAHFLEVCRTWREKE